jgi:hypothetical protein
MEKRGTEGDNHGVVEYNDGYVGQKTYEEPFTEKKVQYAHVLFRNVHRYS